MNKVKSIYYNLTKVQKITVLLSVIILILIISIGIPSYARYKNRISLVPITTWDGSIATNYHAGTGTSEDPYIISNGAELAYFAEQLNYTNYIDTYFALSNDIKLNNGSFTYDNIDGVKLVLESTTYYVKPYTDIYYEDSEFVTSVGLVNKFPAMENFCGIFDGKSYTIYGLYATEAEQSELGMFTNLNGNINNLYLNNTLIYGGVIAGGVASSTNNSSITNVVFSGNVIGENTSIEQTADLNITASNINIPTGESTNYTTLTNSLPMAGANMVSSSISGNYTLENGTDTDVTIKINDVTINNGEFNVDLGSSLLDSISITTNNTSLNNITLLFSNLVYHIEYDYGLAGGIVGLANNSYMENVVNKSNIHAYSTAGGLIGSSMGTTTIFNAYNKGAINSTNIAGGLIGVIEKNTSIVNISNSYDSSVQIESTDSGSIIGKCLSSDTINITNVFNSSANDYVIHTVELSTVNVINSYTTNSNQTYSGTLTGAFASTILPDLQNETYLTTNLLFPKFISYSDLDENEESVWVYIPNKLPILFIDDNDSPIANINVSIHSWNNYSNELANIVLTNNITYSIQGIDELNPLQNIYYYITDESNILSLQDLESVSWTEYSTIEQITVEGSYIIYAKVTDFENNVYYLNSDIISLDLPGVSAQLLFDNNTWTNLRTDLNVVYTNSTINATVEVLDDYSSVVSIKYYLSNEVLSLSELDVLEETSWTTYDTNITVDTTGKHIIYIRIIDINDYKTYINSDYVNYSGYNINSLNIGRQNNYPSDNQITDKSLITYNLTYLENSATDLASIKHNIMTNILLPKDTIITLRDNITNMLYQYTIPTQNDIYNYNDSCQIPECEKMATYPLTLFKVLAKSSGNYTESTYYLNNEFNENFTIIIDFANTNITENYQNFKLIFTAVDNADTLIRSTLINTLKTVNIYSNIELEGTNAQVSLSTDFSNSIILNSDLETNVNIMGSINYKTIDQQNIIDTTYENKKYGLAIVITDGEGAIVNRSNYKNVAFKLDNILYYPDNDNITRVFLSDNYNDLNSVLTIVTNEANSSLSTGTYYIKIKIFTSYDGIYYNNTSTDELTIPLIVGESNSDEYNFNILVEDSNQIIYKNIANSQMPTKIIKSDNIIDSSVKVALYQKNELTAFNQNYTLVDLKDYVTNDLNLYDGNFYNINFNDLVYDINNNYYTGFDLNFIAENFSYTGYKLVFALYSGNNRISIVEKYFIVR